MTTALLSNFNLCGHRKVFTFTIEYADKATDKRENTTQRITDRICISKLLLASMRVLTSYSTMLTNKSS